MTCFFSIEFILGLLLEVFEHSMSLPNSNVTHILQEKIAKFELGHQKNDLDECSVTLEFFLVKYLHTSILIN